MQSAALPDAVAARDLLAVAPTGSGKTLVFAVAAAQLLAGSPSVPGRPRALVVAPTRELASQSAEVLADVGAAAGLKVGTFVGGGPLARDRRALVAPTDIVVGTPGRLVELFRTGSLSTRDVRLLVLDEADHLLGPSFADQTGAIVDRCDDRTALFATTATADRAVEDQLRALRQGLRVHRVDAPAEAPPETAGESGAPRALVVVSATEPEETATSLAVRCRRALFFVSRRDEVEPLRSAISATGVAAAGVTGGASPTRRASAFADLASSAVRVLVTTDLSGRGLDLAEVGHVVNVGPPHSVVDLIHRSGRTGRGDVAAGTVAAVVRPDQVATVSAQARDAGMTVRVIDTAAPTSASLITSVFGPEIPPPRRRNTSAPPARSRRPEQSRTHRPKRKRRK